MRKSNIDWKCRFWHKYVSASNEFACYGECVRCGKKVGYTERVYIRRAIEAEEAFKAAWKEYTLPGMDP